MKQMLIVLVVGLTMFAASAGVSWHLRSVEAEKRSESASTEEKEAGAKAGALGDISAKGIGAKSTANLAALTTPPGSQARASAPSPDSVAQLATSLRQKEESLKTREQNMLVRQKHLEVIHGDLRKERKDLDELRTQLNEEMKALTEKLSVLERLSTELDKKKQEIGKKADDVRQSLTEVETVEQKNVKKMAVTFDSMDAETAAELLQQMADSGKMDMAVKILALMQERQAARVLGQMQDRGAAIQMLEKMKGLTRPANSP